jgi:hypothetical protein
MNNEQRVFEGLTEEAGAIFSYNFGDIAVKINLKSTKHKQEA